MALTSVSQYCARLLKQGYSPRLYNTSSILTHIRSPRNLKPNISPFSSSARRTSSPPLANECLGSDDEHPGFFYSPILPPDPPIWGVDHIKPRVVPPHIVRPPYALLDRARVQPSSETDSGTGPGTALTERRVEARLELGSEEERRMRRSCRLARDTLNYAGSLVKPGITTNAIDSAVHAFILKHNAYPSPLLYERFPRSCCTSVNNVCVHGIPDDRPLEDGDIVTVDVTVYLDGYHGDTARTFLVGDVDDAARQLHRVANEALQIGINACAPDTPFRDIGAAIHNYILEKPFSVCGTFSGHGIGTVFHQRPWIIHEKNEEPGVMLPGHCFTIEPCIIEGTDPAHWIFPDGWTVSTENCARAAQAEHTVLITETGVEVLTR